MNAVERQVADAWNVMAIQAGLPTIRLMTKLRAGHLKARVAEAGLDGVLEAILAVGRSSFCCGARGWRADFDFLLQSRSFARLLEGTYENRREKCRNGALEILMREAEEAARGPIIIIEAHIPKASATPLLDYCAAGDD